MRRAIFTTALLVGAIVSPTTAGPERVNFPTGYKGHVLYATVDRPDNRTVRDLYASPEAARLAALGQPPPDGTVLTMEVYKAKVDEKGEPTRDGSGRMMRTDELLGIFVMEKRRGWGSEYPEAFRNGEWEYARFTVRRPATARVRRQAVLPVSQTDEQPGLRIFSPQAREAAELTLPPR